MMKQVGKKTVGALVLGGVLAVALGVAVGACEPAEIDLGCDYDCYVACDLPAVDLTAPDGGPDPCGCSHGCDCSGDGGADYAKCFAALADAGAP